MVDVVSTVSNLFLHVSTIYSKERFSPVIPSHACPGTVMMVVVMMCTTTLVMLMFCLKFPFKSQSCADLQ
jgi:ABC-type protease/lipase transport system fused ATPase/permease subunit